MIYLFNELSFNVCATNEHEGHQRMIKFIHVCDKAKDLGFDAVRWQYNISGNELAVGYPISKWIGTYRDWGRKLKSILNTASTIESDPTLHAELNPSKYTYNDSIAYGLGGASFIKTLAISIDSGLDWKSSQIALKYNGVEDRIAKHASCLEHLTEHERLFEHNPKHNNQAPWRGASRLECDEPKAQRLLNSAKSIDAETNRLFNYDVDNDKYIVFMAHCYNRYHGFHVALDEFPSMLRSRLQQMDFE